MSEQVSPCEEACGLAFRPWLPAFKFSDSSEPLHSHPGALVGVRVGSNSPCSQLGEAWRQERA